MEIQKTRLAFVKADRVKKLVMLSKYPAMVSIPIMVSTISCFLVGFVMMEYLAIKELIYQMRFSKLI